MTEVPDVIGFALDEALNEIQGRGFCVENVLITRPVKATEPLGQSRVVRVSLVDKAKLQVVVAYQDYGKGGVEHGI